MNLTRLLQPIVAALFIATILAALPSIQAQTDAQEAALNGTGVTYTTPTVTGSTGSSAGNYSGSTSMTLISAGSLSAATISNAGSLSAGTLTLTGSTIYTGSATYISGTNVGALSMGNFLNSNSASAILTTLAQQGQPFSYQIPTTVSLSTLALNPAGSATFVSATGSTLVINNVSQYANLQVDPLTGQLLIGSNQTFTLVSSGTSSTGSTTQPVSGTIASTATPTMTYSASNLPDGLTLDAATGFITGVPTAAGTSNVTLTTKTASGTTTSKTLILTVAPIPPTVTLTTAHSKVMVGNGESGAYTVTLSAPQTSDLYVRYTIKGSAVNGTDYTLLSGVKKIKAGKTTRSIKITPQGEWNSGARRVVKLTLESGTGYTVGTASFVKLVMLNDE